MAVKPEEAKAAVVERAIAHVRERLSGPQATEVERFVRAYCAGAALEGLGELDLDGAELSHWQLLQRRLPELALLSRSLQPRLSAADGRSRHCSAVRKTAAAVRQFGASQIRHFVKVGYSSSLT